MPAKVKANIIATKMTLKKKAASISVAAEAPTKAPPAETKKRHPVFQLQFKISLVQEGLHSIKCKSQ